VDLARGLETLPGAAAALSFAENQGCQPWGGTGPTSKGPVVGRVDEVADDAFRKDVPRAGVRLRPSSTDTVRVAVRLSHRQPGHLGCQLRWRRGVELRWLVALWLPREARGMPCRRSCQKEMTGCLRCLQRGRMSGQNQGTQGRRVSIRRRNGFVDGRGTRLAAGRTPLAGAGVPAGSGSRSWCRRRGRRAQRWRPPHR
jgi:hypothetical protein